MNTPRYEYYHTHVGDWRLQDYGAKIAFIAHVTEPGQLIESFNLQGVTPTDAQEHKLLNPNAFIAPNMHGTLYCRKSFEERQQYWGQHLEDLGLAVIRIHKWSLGNPETKVLPALMHQAIGLKQYNINPVPSLRDIVMPENESMPLHEKQVLEAVQKH